MADQGRSPLASLPALLGAVVVAELLVLRTGTRTLIHIPGLARFETPIQVLSQAGRFFYYLAVVLLIVALANMSYRRLRGSGTRVVASGVVVGLFLGLTMAGRAGALSSTQVGWVSLSLLAVVVALLCKGIRWLPIVLFIFASLAAGWSVLGQGVGGGLSGYQVDTLTIAAEVFLLLAAVTSPLLAGVRPTSSSLLAGGVATAISAVGLAAGGSTLSILFLWNIGVPGWLPGIAYAIAVGGLTTTIWLSVSAGRHNIALVVLLLVAGGVGVISTYQTGLVYAAVLLFDTAVRIDSASSLADSPATRRVSVVSAAASAEPDRA